MSFEHPYPDYAYLEIDPETNEKRWYSSKGMGVGYVHEDRVAELVAEAIRTERDACAKATKPGPRSHGPTHGAWDRGYQQGRSDAEAAVRSRNYESQ